MVKQLGFIYNVENCIGCKACEIACRNENNTSGSVFWRKVDKLTSDTYLSHSCYHCSSPECFRVCPENAFSKRSDGIVLIDSNKCNGCKLCVTACPFGAPQYDFETRKVTKCQMCYPRQDVGMKPACVEACTTNALSYTDLNKFYSQNIIRTVDGFPDIRITQPSVLFYPAKTKKRYFLND